MIIKMPESECTYGQLYLDDKYVVYQVNDLKIKIYPNKKIYALIYNQDKNFMKCIHELLCKLNDIDQDKNMLLVLDLDKLYIYNEISLNVRGVYDTNPTEYTKLIKKIENVMYLFRKKYPVQLVRDHYKIRYNNVRFKLSISDLSLSNLPCNTKWLYLKCDMFSMCTFLYLKKVWRAYNDYLREVITSIR